MFDCIIMIEVYYMKDIKLYEKVPPIKNNFQVKIHHYEGSGWLSPHWHEHTELLFFISGECECFCDGKKSYVKAGDMIVVNSTEIHTYYAEKKVSYYCIITYPSFFSDIDYSDFVIKNHIPNDPVVKECVMGIKDNFNSGTAEGDMLVKSYNYRLFAHLIKNYRDESGTLNDSLKSEKLNKLDKVLSYIESHYNEKISTMDLAGMCYFSEGYFCRFFKKVTGRTTAEYISEYRIRKASIMLKSTDSSISDIASMTGFEDANYFARVFKKLKGITPSEYRRSNK